METKEEEYETAVLIKNIQNKKYVLDYGYKFFASKGLGKSYRLKNTKTEINFIVHNSEIAYELMKKFEECKRTDKALDGIEVQLTMIPKSEHPETYFNTINIKNDKNNQKEHKMSSALKASIQKVFLPTGRATESKVPCATVCFCSSSITYVACTPSRSVSEAL